MKSVVVGGGNLGHAITVTLAENCRSVGLLTRDCAGFGSALTARLPSGDEIRADRIAYSERPEELITSADVVILAVPSHVLAGALRSIRHVVTPRHVVGSVVASGGFFWMAREILGKGPGLFAFQRVPFICRVVERGALVDISGLKDELYMAQTGAFRSETRSSELVDILGRSFRTKIVLLESYLEATVSNSNPILHGCRLDSLLERGAGQEPLHFYRDWDLRSSELALQCDAEILRIVDMLPIRFSHFKSLAEHYGIGSAVELTDKLSSIDALREITFPVDRDETGRTFPDRKNRYFIEDVPFGLVVLRALAQMVGVRTPTIDGVLSRLQNFLGESYLSSEGDLSGCSIASSGIPQNFGVSTIKDLLDLE